MRIVIIFLSVLFIVGCKSNPDGKSADKNPIETKQNMFQDLDNKVNTIRLKNKEINDYVSIFTIKETGFMKRSGNEVNQKVKEAEALTNDYSILKKKVETIYKEASQLKNGDYDAALIKARIKEADEKIDDLSEEGRIIIARYETFSHANPVTVYKDNEEITY